VSIQRETGASSWFGFALLVRARERALTPPARPTLRGAGIECRPVVSGNFVRQPVIRHLDHEVHGELPNADHVHDHGLFVGNHHFPVES
jgi:CDP-6-deoxy-D-xylo-4-hexulose-3-dehydrase